MILHSVIIAVCCSYWYSFVTAQHTNPSVRKIDQVHFFGREGLLNEVYNTRKSHKQGVTDFLHGHQALVKSLLDEKNGDDHFREIDSDIQQNSTLPIATPPAAPPAPTKPKPRPLPIKRKPNPTAPSIPQTYYEGKLYSATTIPYQRFGHQLLTTEENEVIVSSASTNNPAHNTLYIFNTVYRTTTVEGDGGEAESGMGNTTSPVSTTTEVEYELRQTLSSNHLVSSLPSSSFNTAVFDGYGHNMLSISSSSSSSENDGNNINSNNKDLLVAAPYDDTVGYFSGKVYIYHYHSDTGEYQSAQSLFPSSQYALGSLFGAAMASGSTSNSGSSGKLEMVVIGAPGESYFTAQDLAQNLDDTVSDNNNDNNNDNEQQKFHVLQGGGSSSGNNGQNHVFVGAVYCYLRNAVSG
jgi:hypothetical protein